FLNVLKHRVARKHGSWCLRGVFQGRLKKFSEVHNIDKTNKTIELEFYCPGPLKAPLTYIAKTKIFDRYNVQGGEYQHQYTCKN
ncbi:hypothetical protein LL962_11480, partial [Xanthomonas sp. NCPPB 1067]|nr:hypothetical protein [Xanthomonas sp. NCPPB 1067]